MSNGARERKSSKRLDAPMKTVGATSWADHSPSQNGYLSTAMWAPFDRYTARMGMVLLGYLIELLGSLVFCLFTNLARQNLSGVTTTAPLDTLSAVLVGAVSALTFYMATGFRLQPDEQPRHISWTITLANLLTFRTGFIPAFFYLCFQTAGAALAGVILWGLGSGRVPAGPTIPFATAFGFEILGSFLIVFAWLFNTMYGAATLEEENANTRSGQASASIGRFLATAALAAGDSYSFEPIIYIAGLIGFGLVSNVDNPYNASPAIFILTPMVGMVAAVIIYYVLLLLFRLSGPTKLQTGTAAVSSSADSRESRPSQATKLDDLVTRHPKQ